MRRYSTILAALLLVATLPAPRQVFHRQIATDDYTERDLSTGERIDGLHIKRGAEAEQPYLLLQYTGHAVDMPVLAGSAGTQEVSITAITQVNITKVKIQNFNFDADSNTVTMRLKYQDASNNTLIGPAVPNANFATPSSAGAPCTSSTTLGGLALAMNNPVGGETGTEPRKQQARILNYMLGQGCLPAGATLVP